MTGSKPEINNVQFYSKPIETKGWAGFKEFVWNPKDGTTFGRTASSWCKYL